MLARKGVLMSDPSVQEMTHAQWMFEAKALSMKDVEEAEIRQELVGVVFNESVRAFRETLISVLGVNIGAGKAEKGQPTPYTPFVFFTAQHDYMEEMLKRHEEHGKLTEVLDSEGHDELNEQLMNLDMGDLEPIFSGQNSDDPFERWYSPQMQEMLRDLGVEVTKDSEEGVA